MKDFEVTTGYLLTLHLCLPNGVRKDWQFVCASENLALLAYENITESGQTEIESYDIKEINICTLKVE